jgi:hypothetical protein
MSRIIKYGGINLPTTPDAWQAKGFNLAWQFWDKDQHATEWFPDFRGGCWSAAHGYSDRSGRYERTYDNPPKYFQCIIQRPIIGGNLAIARGDWQHDPHAALSNAMRKALIEFRACLDKLGINHADYGFPADPADEGVIA